MYFTFGVITYNQEKYILETLESIKYQIQNFGENINFKLVISDDCSKDDTILYVHRWVEKNANLFVEMKIFTSDTNQGVVRNYEKMLGGINTKYYKVIAGDDLFSNNNLFDYLNLLKDFDIVTYFPFYLTEGKIYYDKNRIYKMFINKDRDRDYYLKEIKKGGLFHTPSTFYNEELYTSEVKDFVHNFKLFEDDPRWYMFIKVNKNIKIKFILEPLIIYRVHGMSISNSTNTTLARDFSNELNMLRRKYYQDETSIILKIYILLQIFSEKIKLKYFKPINYFIKLDTVCNKIMLLKSKKIKNQKKIIEEHFIQAEKYYTFIKKSSEKYKI